MRLFIAINFDEVTKEKLIAIQNKLKVCSAGNFSKPENLHLTILFLGEVEDYVQVIKCINAHFNKLIELSFYKTGNFNNNIYWVGIRHNPVLNELYSNICNDLIKDGFNIYQNKRFTPHVTLGRKVSLTAKPNLLFEEFSMTATRVSLMESLRINGKLMYKEIFGKSVPLITPFPSIT